MAHAASFCSIDPATEELLGTLPQAPEDAVDGALRDAHASFASWRTLPISERAGRLRDAARVLRTHRDHLAAIATVEMGKPIRQARAEVEKCATGCDYYAEHAPAILADQPRSSSGSRSWVQFPPLGVVLAIMPWNFPFWQVFRFAAPTLAAGNTAILKHAANVPRCAQACQWVFEEAGFPAGVFTNLLVSGPRASALIARPEIAAVTLTGSEDAGAAVAEAAGRVLKKCVLELGGSDPFIVLTDADLDEAASIGVQSRYQNAGQSCIAAKRFIVAESVYAEFRDRFIARTRELRTGDPNNEDTDMGPLARGDLRDALEAQIKASVARGARIVLGGSRRSGRGYFFEPTVVENVTPGMPLFDEEVFGPVAALISARDESEAVRLANDSRYGLGANLWTRDLERAARLSREIEAGQVFVNGMVASDPRLPFGGVKRSGYGRELADFGIREFVNVQTVWTGPRRET